MFRAAFSREEALPLIPEPERVEWGEAKLGDWVTAEPFSDVEVSLDRQLGSHRYEVRITPHAARILAGSEAALADARSTFAQVVYLARVRGEIAAAATVGEPAPQETVSIPCVTISDSPARAFRGVAIDLSNTFVPVDALRRIVDALAIYRFNTLVLTLSGDEAWRWQVRGYPKLTAPLEDSGEMYSQEELRELAQFARERGVNVVPSVSFPGRAGAAIAAYPALGASPVSAEDVTPESGESGTAGDASAIGAEGNSGSVKADGAAAGSVAASAPILGAHDAAVQFIQDTLEQLCEIFPAPFIHINGTDAPINEWENSAEVASQLEAWGLERVDEAMGHVLSLASGILARYEKRMLVWEAGKLIRLPDSALVLAGRSRAQLEEIVGRGLQAVVAYRDELGLDSPGVSFESLAKATLVPAELEPEAARKVVGVLASVRGDDLKSADDVERVLFPRLLAVSHRAWGAGSLKPRHLRDRARAHAGLLDLLGVSHSNELD